MKTARMAGTLMLSLLAFGWSGCDDSFGPEDEVHGTILSVSLAASTITLTNQTTYFINGETEFEDGLIGLHDPRLMPGAFIEIDYFHDNGVHVAAEVELDTDDD